MKKEGITNVTTGYEGPRESRPKPKRWVVLIADHFMQSTDEGQFHATILCDDEPRGLIKLLDGAELEWLNSRLKAPQLPENS